uniref:tRNA pseudouridine synthase n=1 Tax=Meloidogyne incognita TaxID=6306 RepID=A0A914MWI5_MELIC
MEGDIVFRKFLFWLRYDGSRFSSMAKGAAPHTGASVFKLFESCLARLFDEDCSKIRSTTVSRTDAKVHALRTPFLVKPPNERTSIIIQNPIFRSKFVDDFNDLIKNVGFENSLKLLEITPVAKGFNPNFHVSYRRYVYRIRRFYTMDAYLKSRQTDQQSLIDLAEFDYSWAQPPSFNVEKANEMCAILRRPGLDYASFYFHKMGDRLKGKNFKTTTDRRWPRLLQIYRGEPYFLPDEDAEYFNIEFVAHGFLRQQIRRMVSLISLAARKIDHAKFVAEFLLKDPDPTKYHQIGMKLAPPNGLFLADVVYDPRMFSTPIPFYPNAWDEEVSEDNKLESEEEDDEEGVEYYDEREERRQLKFQAF